MSDQGSAEWKSVLGAFASGRGSEDGFVRLDEEHPLGVRVTMEEGGRTAPWSITCGLYGWMCHTVFCGSESEARSKLAAMKERLLELAAMARGDANSEVHEAIRRFVDDF
jgi:hypothetical protein